MKEDEAREIALRIEGATDGTAWVDLILQKEARVGFELHWLMFVVGQSGAMMEVVKENPERAGELEEILLSFEATIADLQQATKELTGVAEEMVANSRRNMERFMKRKKKKH